MHTTYKVSFTIEADNNIEDIFTYIYKHSLSYTTANNFITALYRNITETLGYMPRKFPLYSGKIRVFPYSKNRNYLIFYEIIEDLPEVRVIKIVNAKNYSSYHTFIDYLN